MPYRDVCGKCGARRVDRQIGLEPDPDAHVEALVGVFREVWRVLRPDGTLWLNYGDAYASGTGGDRREGTNGRMLKGRAREQVIGYKPKDLMLMPFRVAMALQADGWYLRSAITLCKQNPMPESVADRPTNATEMLFLLTKRASYFYDSEAVREPATYGRRDWSSVNGNLAALKQERGSATVSGGDPSAGRNKRNWWVLSSQSCPDAHFATFPEKLVEPCILAGTSEWGACRECGAPWRRVVDRTPCRSNQNGNDWQEGRALVGHHGPSRPGSFVGGEAKTVGWAKSCPCETDDVEPCVVLDPFAGSGTVGKVATKLGRRSILIELSPTYAGIIHKRNAQLGLMI